MAFRSALQTLAGSDGKLAPKKTVAQLEPLVAGQLLAIPFQKQSEEYIIPLMKILLKVDDKNDARLPFLIQFVSSTICTLGTVSQSAASRVVADLVPKLGEVSEPVHGYYLRVLASLRAAQPGPKLVQSVEAFLKQYVSPPEEKKRSMISLPAQNKSKRAAERRERSLHHCICIAALRSLSPTSLALNNGLILVNTIEQHLSKPEAVDVIRECLYTLTDLHRSGLLPSPHSLDRFLPSKLEHLHTPNVTVKKEKDTKRPEASATVMPVHEPFTAIAVAQYCLTLLSASHPAQPPSPTKGCVGGRGKVSVIDRHAAALKLLVHHPSANVFMQVVDGIYKTGLCDILFHQDTAYSGSTPECVIHYVFYRIQTLVSSPSQLQIHAGLRLIGRVCSIVMDLFVALCEGTIEFEISKLSDMLFSLELVVQNVFGVYCMCPHISVHACVALLWLNALFICLPPQTDPFLPHDEYLQAQVKLFTDSLSRVTQRIQTLSLWSQSHTTQFLNACTDVLRLCTEECKLLLMKPFVDFVIFLCSKCLSKVDIVHFQSLLKTIIVEFDVNNKRAKLNSLENDLDVDIIPHSRSNGCNFSFKLILRLLEGTTCLPYCSSPAEMKASVQYDAVQRKQWVKLVSAAVFTAGEYGNLCCAEFNGSKTPTLNSKICSWVNAIHNLSTLHIQSDITQECVRALVKIAVRSNDLVRDHILNVLRSIHSAQASHYTNTFYEDIDAFESPILSSIQMLERISELKSEFLDIHKKFDYSQHSSDFIDVIIGFLDAHEYVKGVCSAFCILERQESFKLFGKSSKRVLEKAYEAKSERQHCT